MKKKYNLSMQDQQHLFDRISRKEAPKHGVEPSVRSGLSRQERPEASAADAFDLRQAVIWSEILKPKFDE